MNQDSKGRNFKSTGPDKRWFPTRPMGLARALQKAGYGTRRRTDEMVLVGRIRVDGEPVVDPSFQVDRHSTIELDGRPLLELVRNYFALHKPMRVVCSVSDGLDRRLVDDFLPKNIPGLQAAGRLDERTTGLLLVSNDKDWNELVTGMTHLEQEFQIQVEGELTDLELSVVTAGVHLPGLGLFRPHSVQIVQRTSSRTVLTMVIREGKIRQVRRMLSTLRHRITLLRRERIGEISLDDLPPGGLRPLEGREVQYIRDQRTANTPNRRKTRSS